MVEELRTLINIISQYEHLTFRSLATTMLVAVLCGFIIYMVYRFFYRGLVYSENFGILIVLITGATAFIIITIGANLVLSLGMVGALSIVRFRAAIKEPLDVGFLFLGIAAGLAAGARLYLVAIVGTVALCLIYIAMSFLRKEKRNFLLIINYQHEHDEEVAALLKDLRYKLKNKTVAGSDVELTVEVHVKRNQTDFLAAFTSAEFVSGASLLEYNGDYT
jgi:uncharacterized membrane protein YhiD involved in acid resistance